MQSFRRFSLLSIAISAVMSTAGFLADIGVACARAVTRCARWLFSFEGMAPAVAQAASEPLVMVDLVREAAYRVGRLLRRERVERQPSYKHCPSV